MNPTQRLLCLAIAIPVLLLLSTSCSAVPPAIPAKPPLTIDEIIICLPTEIPEQIQARGFIPTARNRKPSDVLKIKISIRIAQITAINIPECNRVPGIKTDKPAESVKVAETGK